MQIALFVVERKWTYLLPLFPQDFYETGKPVDVRLILFYICPPLMLHHCEGCGTRDMECWLLVLHPLHKLNFKIEIFLTFPSFLTLINSTSISVVYMWYWLNFLPLSFHSSPLLLLSVADSVQSCEIVFDRPGVYAFYSRLSCYT